MCSRIDVRQERHLRGRHSVEELGTQVVAHEPVIAGERQRNVRVRTTCPRRQRREIQADRPTLGPLDELAHVFFDELDPGGLEE
jgi:hypothetical protein